MSSKVVSLTIMLLLSAALVACPTDGGNGNGDGLGEGLGDGSGEGLGDGSGEGLGDGSGETEEIEGTWEGSAIGVFRGPARPNQTRQWESFTFDHGTIEYNYTYVDDIPPPKKILKDLQGQPFLGTYTLREDGTDKLVDIQYLEYGDETGTYVYDVVGDLLYLNQTDGIQTADWPPLTRVVP